MKTNFTFLKLSVLFFTVSLSAQQQATPEKQSEKNPDKFKQMYDLLATPNMYRTASGAPGPEYYQQQADYKMDIELDDKNTKLYGAIIGPMSYHVTDYLNNNGTYHNKRCS